VAVGAARLAVEPGEQLHRPVELGGGLGGELRLTGGLGRLDRGPEALLSGEALTDRFDLEILIGFGEGLFVRLAEGGIGVAVKPDGGGADSGRGGGGARIPVGREVREIDGLGAGVEADVAPAAALEEAAVGGAMRTSPLSS
jgi:hypothetical protein